MQPQVWQRSKDEITTAHTRDGDAVQVLQAKFSHRFPQHALVGQNHTAVGDAAGGFHEVFLAHATDDEAELLQMGLRAYRHDDIAQMQLGFGCGGMHFVFRGPTVA